MIHMSGKQVHLLVEPVIHQRHADDLGAFLVAFIWSRLEFYIIKVACVECQKSRWLLTRNSSFKSHKTPQPPFTLEPILYLLHVVTFFWSFWVSSELSMRSVFVAQLWAQPRAAIGWYTKLIIQLISPLWLFLSVLCNESPMLLKWHSTFTAMSCNDSQLIPCSVLRNNGPHSSIF